MMEKGTKKKESQDPESLPEPKINNKIGYPKKQEIKPPNPSQKQNIIIKQQIKKQTPEP